MKWRKWIIMALMSGVLSGGMALAQRMELVWPTPSKAWMEGRPAADWLQHAGSGDPATGGFGGVRNGGTRFHEGIDIKPVARARNGEATDPVFAAMGGVVRHVSSSAGNSSYGRYVVLEHPDLTPAIYTLYAHLARLAPEVRVGARVLAGQTLGTMGHSSGGYMIPIARAHLHFEVGLAVTRDFQAWYDRRKFGSRNEHGMWNGMNLIGMDPLAFYNDWRAGRFTEPREFLMRQPTAVRLRIASHRTPDFVARYPSLLTKEVPLGPMGGWEIRFTWNGLPFAWTPLSLSEVSGMPPGRAKILEVDESLQRRERSRSLAVRRRGDWDVGSDLEMVLQQLFGTR